MSDDGSCNDPMCDLTKKGVSHKNHDVIKSKKIKLPSKEELKKYLAAIDMKKLSMNMMIASILYLISIIGISIFLISVIYAIAYEYNLPTIPLIQYGENKWLKVDNLKIIDSTNQNYAITGDELTYKANFTNISNYSLIFVPEIQINFSDSMPSKIQYDSMSLNPHQNVSRTFDFLLTHEGSNQLTLLFEVKNQSNGNYLDRIHANAVIPGLSFSNKLQHDSNSINLKNSIAASGIGVITATALFISYTSSRSQTNIAKKQLRRYEQELKNRMRPWVAPISLEAKFMEFPNSTLGTVAYDEGVNLLKKGLANDSDAIVTFQIRVKNNGSLPALNVVCRQMVEVENILREKLESSNPIKTISLMPEEFDKNSIIIPLRQCDEGCYVGFHVEYSSSGNSKSMSSKVWKITYNDEILINSWVDEPENSVV